MNMKASDSSAKLEKSYFDVLGLCCSSEVLLIEKLLKPLEGVHEVSVVVPSKTVIVIHDSLLVSQIQIVKTLNQARLEANVRVKGESNFRNKWPNPFAVACGVLLLLSFLKYFYSPLKWLALGAVAVGIVPIILKSFAFLRSFRLDINTLMLIAVGGSILLKDYWEAGTIVFLFTISEWLESRASHKATSVMSSLMNISPQRAVLAETGKEVNASEVAVNTILAVKAGEVIPIDGTVVEGKSEVDEKALTGESFPVSKQVDSTVWAGTINLNGYISVKTTALAEDCVVARMAKLVEEAQNNQSKTQRYIDKCAKYYTPAIVVIAGCLAAIPAAMRVHDRNKWYHLALVVLVSACPCALVLSTPVAAFCALSRAATSGLLVKGAEYLETLSGVKIIGFDKTGTITRGEFCVSNFQSLADDVSLEKLLYWVSSVESKSSHPMAAALVDYAQTRSVKPRADDVGDFKNFPGEGIYGKIEGKHVYVGNRKIAIRAHCSRVPNNEDGSNEGKSIGYIVLGSSLAGVFSLSDTCRTGVKEALDELKSMGIKTAMLTGDSQAAANYAQNQLGGALEVVYAELLPQDKAKIIKEFQTESPTAMVGDGINDAPALATADIGISMGVSGSALATETGNVILMSNDIGKIPKAVRLARKTRRKIFENIFLAIVTKAAIIALAIAGHPLVWAAVLADVGTCLLVIFNSMLLLRGTTVPRSMKKHSGSHHNHQRHCCSSNTTCSSGSKGQAKYVPINCSSKKCTNVEKKGCCGEDKVQTCEPVNCSSKKCSPMEKDGCCGQDRVQPMCEPVHCYSKRCSSVEKTDGCCSQDNKVSELDQHKITVEEHGGCSHDDHVHEMKHLAQAMTGTSNCGGHDGHIHESDSEQGTEENHGCCVHDKQVHEVMHCGGTEDGYTCCSHSDDEEDGCCAHTDDGADPGKQSLQGVENKHDCCDHSDDEIHEVKDVVQPKESDHGCCSNVVDVVHMVKHLVQVNENKQECCAHDHEHDKEEQRVQGTEKQHGCCAHSHEADETKHNVQDSNCNEISKDLESQIIESKCWGNSARKEGDCSHNQTKHQQPHCHSDHHSEIHETSSPSDHNCEKSDHHHHHQHNHHRHHHRRHHHHHHHHHHAKKYISEEELGKVVTSCCVNHGLEKRHVGGCCKSYRKECCVSLQFGVGFSGGLSEIVIE